MKKNLNEQLSLLSELDEHKSKKEQIIELFKAGKSSIEEIALLSASRTSYVGSVLQAAGLITNYFDLYTSTAHSMNVYSKDFRGKLGFKNEFAARQSIREINRIYREFEEKQDRAGQHHALTMAMTMFNRARWTGKLKEAEVFRRWLVAELQRAIFNEPENENQDVAGEFYDAADVTAGQTEIRKAA